LGLLWRSYVYVPELFRGREETAMSSAAKPARSNPRVGIVDPHPAGPNPAVQPDGARRQAVTLRLLWERRRFLVQAAATGLLISTLVAFLIPKSYTANEELMPPDSHSPTGMALMAGLATQAGAGTGNGLSGLAGDLLGLKNSGALFIGVLRSETAQDRLVEQFGLQKVYGRKLLVDARTKLDENTAIAEDRKSGIISISVTDHDPQRAAAIANAYVAQLNSLVAELSTSAAHRERVFLDERLVVVKHDLDEAANQLAQFSSKSNTLDIQTEGRAMLDAAGTLSGQLVAAQSQLEGLRQIYADDNARVRALNARVAELRNQLKKLGGTEEDAAKVGDAGSAPANGMPYPTIRSLPLLGAKYSDYYRRAKIEETVFELLTEQSELAKVEEAKETPSVKVLDRAQLPQKKSAPARLMIMSLGAFLAFTLAIVWTVGAEQWRATDPEDPRRILAQEVFATLKTPKKWLAPEAAGRNDEATKE
jgi:uncharacterized protein involved in exopolysaccharide biosynthesis